MLLLAPLAAVAADVDPPIPALSTTVAVGTSPLLEGTVVDAATTTSITVVINLESHSTVSAAGVWTIAAGTFATLEPRRYDVGLIATDPDGNTTSVLLAAALDLFPAALNVDTTADVDDAVYTPGNLSLRESIRIANTLAPAPATIGFDLPATPTIALLAPLPILAAPITIDGTTQPGTGRVTIDGAAAPASTSGFDIHSTATLRGLAIHSMPAAGVRVGGPAGLVTLESNAIGTNTSGTLLLSNGGPAVDFAPTSPTAVLVMAGNHVVSTAPVGVQLSGGSARLYGNLINVDAAGSAPLGGSTVAVQVDSPGSLQFGTDGDGAGDVAEANVIGGDGSIGVLITASGNAPRRIAGNRIGVNAAGTARLGAGLLRGIEITGAPDGLLIGTDADGTSDAIEANIFSALGASIRVAGGTATRIAGNRIGTDASGAVPLGPGVVGVLVTATATATYIGESNIIAHADTAGVQVDASDQLISGNVIRDNARSGVEVIGAAERVTIVDNSFARNGRAAIDLGANGITLNDPNDSDLGPNRLVNFPVLLAPIDGATTLDFQLAAESSTVYTVRVYTTGTPGAAGYGEGAVAAGSALVTTDVAGRATGTVPLGLPAAAGTWYTATATDAAGNTSEFSRVVTIGAAPTVESIALPDASPTNAATVDYLVTFSEAVSPVTTADFAAVEAGITGSVVDSVNPLTGAAATFGGATRLSIARPAGFGGNFTIELWLRTLQATGGDTVWYAGRGIVDGTVPLPGSNDFGLSLSNGKVHFGTGNPDTTIRSHAINNGEWHHIAAVREATTGTLTLYVDGFPVATGPTSNADLTSPTLLSIGSLATGAGFFVGDIDQLRLWGRPLSPAEVRDVATRSQISDPALLGQWDFEEAVDLGAGGDGLPDDFADVTGSGNNADTVVGSVVIAAADRPERRHRVTVQTGGLEGTLALEVRAASGIRDAAGNAPANTPFVSAAYSIDKFVPAPNALDLIASDDSGRFDNDDITNVSSATFTGTAEGGSIVELFSSLQGSLGTTVAAGAGPLVPWSHLAPTSGTLVEGIHFITAVATDALGNVSAPSTGLAVTIDRTAPDPPGLPDLVASSDSGRSNSDNITNDNTPTITGTAEADAIVRLDNLSGTLATVLASGGVYTVTITPALADGLTSLSATAEDVAGNISPRGPAVNILIDTVPPAAPVGLDLLAADDSGRSSEDNVTNVVQPRFQGTTEPDALVRLRDYNQPFSIPVGSPYPALADSMGYFQVGTAPPLDEGLRIIGVFAEDVAGNVGPIAFLPVLIDTIAPAAPTNLDLVDASDTGISMTDNLTRINTPTFTGNAESDSRVELLANGGVVGVASAPSGGFVVSAATLGDGPYNITARATDVAGNTGPETLPLGVVIDTTPPEIRFAGTEPRTTQTQVEGDITLNLTHASDNLSAITSMHLLMRFEYYEPEFSIPWSSVASLNSTGLHVHTPRFGSGRYYFDVLAFDAAGNSTPIGVGNNGAGLLKVVYNATRNGRLVLAVPEGGREVFPMTDAARVWVDYATAIPKSYVAVERFDTVPVGFEATVFIKEHLHIQGGFLGLAAMEWVYDPVSSNELTRPLDRVYRLEGTVRTLYPGEPGTGATVDIPNTTVRVTGIDGFSWWYAGADPVDVPDWWMY